MTSTLWLRRRRTLPFDVKMSHQTYQQGPGFSAQGWPTGELPRNTALQNGRSGQVCRLRRMLRRWAG